MMIKLQKIIRLYAIEVRMLSEVGDVSALMYVDTGADLSIV
ncbi:MAG: hypothetical protein AAGD32_14045 [Planctomycetota bacterium]